MDTTVTVDDASDYGSPSGAQYAISHSTARAQITQVGATLRSYTVDGADVIDGFGVDQRASDGRGQVLAPWPNRLADGRYRFGGHDCQAPLNEPSRRNAIHGLVRWLDWSVVAHSRASLTMSCAVRPQPGYEWRLDLEVTYTLDDVGLTVSTQATNAGLERAPFGIGFHPYLTVGSPSIDRLELMLPAGRYMDPGHPGEVPSMASAADTPLDFTTPRRIETTQLDTAFGELTRDDGGQAVTRLTDPVDGRSCELWVDEAFRYLMVYTADRVERPDRRRRAVAIEPMTCPPEALRSGVDLVELEPGEAWRGSWGLRPRRRAAP